MKSLTEAVNIRSHILRQFERASADPSLIDESALNIVIVGGGPTGVEMSGALAELFERVLPKDYPDLEVAKAKIILVEMLDYLMAPYSDELRDYTAEVLRGRGIELRLGQALAEVREGEVELKNGEVIPTQTLIWAAGVRGHPLVDALGVELERGYRLKVNPDLSLPGHPYAFAAGGRVRQQRRGRQALPAGRASSHPRGTFCRRKLSWPTSKASVNRRALSISTRATWRLSGAAQVSLNWVKSFSVSSCAAFWAGWRGCLSTWFICRGTATVSAR